MYIHIYIYIYEPFMNRQPKHYTHAFTIRSQTTVHEQRVAPSKHRCGHS